MSKKKIHIFGGGIGGLSAAFHLVQGDRTGNLDITVHERSTELGGQMYTHVVNGVPTEHTCRIFPRNYRVWYGMMEVLGLLDHFTERDVITLEHGERADVSYANRVPRGRWWYPIRLLAYLLYTLFLVVKALFWPGSDRTILKELVMFLRETFKYRGNYDVYNGKAVSQVYDNDYARQVQHLTGVKSFHAVKSIRQQTHDRLATSLKHCSTNPCVMMTLTSVEVIQAIRVHLEKHGVRFMLSHGLESLQSRDSKIVSATIRVLPDSEAKRADGNRGNEPSSSNVGRSETVAVDAVVLALGLPGVVRLANQLPFLRQLVPGVDRLGELHADQEFGLHLLLREDPLFVNESVYIIKDSQWCLSVRKLPLTRLHTNPNVKRVIFVAVNEEYTPGRATGKMAKACNKDELILEIWTQLGSLGTRLQSICAGVLMDQYWIVESETCNAKKDSETYNHPTFSVDGQTILDLTPLPRPLPGKEQLLPTVSTACSNLWIGGEGVATPYGLQFVESSCWTGEQIAQQIAAWASKEQNME